MKRIYRSYADTEVSSIVVNVECPHCGNEWQEDDDKTECGKTYTLFCDDEDGGCGKEFEMHFDAS
ncbi:hypothetical protein P9274_20090 [Schinkia azotoformans]|uniref:hypothetical protein n=1 Tax=Schinkia azotoformans TaxID=1454 RepID=UPI002E1A1BA4|nr:hypothetical protein [Schinkia azotoformans]